MLCSSAAQYDRQASGRARLTGSGERMFALVAVGSHSHSQSRGSWQRSASAARCCTVSHRRKLPEAAMVQAQSKEMRQSSQLHVAWCTQWDDAHPRATAFQQRPFKRWLPRRPRRAVIAQTAHLPAQAPAKGSAEGLNRDVQASHIRSPSNVWTLDSSLQISLSVNLHSHYVSRLRYLDSASIILICVCRSNASCG